MINFSCVNLILLLPNPTTLNYTPPHLFTVRAGISLVEPHRCPSDTGGILPDPVEPLVDGVLWTILLSQDNKAEPLQTQMYYSDPYIRSFVVKGNEVDLVATTTYSYHFSTY